MLIIVSAMGGLPKCPKFTCSGHTFRRLLVIVDFDDDFNTKVCSVDNIIIAVYINGVGHMGSSEMSQIWVLW